MKSFNIINDNTIVKDKLAVGEVYEELNMHGEVVNRYLLHPPEVQSTTLPLHLKMSKFKSVYLPVINYSAKELKFTDELMELNAEELVVDIKMMTKDILNNPNLILLADESVSGLYVDSLAGRKEKFKKVILYCKGKVDWNDVVYDWKDLTDNLRIIIGENQMYLSNRATPYENISDLKPPITLRSQFNLEIEIQTENDDEIDFGFIDSETKDKREDNRLVNAKWKKVIEGLRSYTPNIYYCNLDNSDIVTNYNIYNTFEPNLPVIIITHKQVRNHRRKKDMDIRYLDLNFNPVTDIVFKSVELYKKAFKTLK